MKIIPQLFILVFLIVACTKEIDMPFPDTEPQIVLNGILHPDSLISLILTKTLPVTDSQDFPVITDAVVRLYEDNRLLGNLVYQDSAYTLDYYPQAGHQYTVEVEVPGYPMLMASEVVPYAPDANICYKNDSVYAYSSTSIQISIEDKPATNNYYWLYGMSTKYENPDCKYMQDTVICEAIDSSQIFTRKVPYYQSFSPIPDRFNAFIDNISGGVTQYDHYMRIDDASLDGETLALDIAGPGYRTILNLDDRLSFTLNVISASQTYDRYLKSSVTYFLNNSYGDDDHKIFTEPVSIYSNIENGTGIFAAYNSVSIDVEDYPCE